MFNANNHPILTGGIAGVHNGHVNNDDRIFNKLGWDLRQGRVDSEAIFALMAYGAGDDALARYINALETAQGSVAVAWLNQEDENNVLHLARASTNPICIGTSDKGSIVFASTMHAVKEAMYAAGMSMRRLGELEEGQYFAFKDGRDIAARSFTPPASYYSYSSVGGFGGYATGDYEDWSKDNKRQIDAAKRGNGRTINVVNRTLSPTSSVVSLLEPPKALPAPATHLEELDNEPVQRLGGVHRPASVGTFVDLERAFDHTHDFLMDNSRYMGQYADREDNINSYLSEVIQDSKTEEEARIYEQEAVWKLHMSLRPGDFIETIAFEQVCYGEVVTMPLTWPSGRYVLRIRVPIEEYVHDDPEGPWEYVLVEREAFEFELMRSHTAPAGEDN